MVQVHSDLNIDPTKKIGAVMVVGAGIGGMQAALDLADGGYKVYLVDKISAIGGHMAQLDKTFPTNDCAMCTISPKLVECEKHLNIEIITNAEVDRLGGEPGHFKVRLLKNPGYVDPVKCNACGDCEAVCPVLLPDEHDEGLDLRKVIHKRYPQAIPNTYTIDKGARPPCTLTCPAGVNVQGYVALVSQGKFKEALDLVKERHPLPGVCGRICHHPCEDKCNRWEIDEGLATNSLKRFVADYERARRREEGGEEEPVPVVEKNGHKVAIVGSGPAGLTAASDLAQKGYEVTVFEAAPEPGGMLRMGIPNYRLPKDILAEEIHEVLRLGIELKISTPIGPDLTLDDLKAQGYEAIFLAVGAQKSRRLNLEGADLDGVLHGVEFLRDVNLGEKVELGQRVLVIGGGNVAVDVAQTALRLGAPEVHMVCLESREEMPAHEWEIEDASEEQIVFHCSKGPKRFLGNGKVTGMETLSCSSVFDENGRFNPKLDPGTESVIEADTIIVAIGQASDLSFLGEDSPIQVTRRGTFEVDEITLQTSVPWIFAGGDVVLGPASAVEAVAQGYEAAISIDRYLSGVDLKAGRSKEKEEPAGVPERRFERKPRQKMARVSAAERVQDFREIDLGFTEEQAVAEASRCLACGLCSECLQCVKACQPGAIDHEMKPRYVELDVGAMILAPGFERFNPELKGEYGYGRYPNVITSLEYERILSASGPSQGEVLRPSDEQMPQRIAWIQCVGSRDVLCGNEYCSSVCCMYATKEAVMTKEHEADIETTIFYNDIRAFGKGFEHYYENAKNTQGVRYVKSIVSTLKELQQSKNLRLQYALEDGQIIEEEFDLVVLSVGLNPSLDARATAQQMGVELNPYGFVQTGKFSPNETSRPGIYVCGAFEAPMDIPEAVMTASSAAALAGELLAEVRGTMVAAKVYPVERDVTGERPRVGVFVCHCGTNIARVVDVKDVVEYARTLGDVVYAEDNLYTCSTDTQRKIIEVIREKNLNRVVVSSCTPRTHEPLFQETLREAGLNKYLFEMANIRDQCSWVHANWPDKATEKARDLVHMAVGRARTLESLKEMSIEIQRRGLVVGGGLAGMTAALSLAAQGFETYLLEKEPELGGRMRNLRYTLEGDDPKAHLDQLLRRVADDPRITVYTNAEVVDFSGHVGHFTTRVRSNDQEVDLEHGIVIVATGGVEYKPDEYRYGQDPRVLTQKELEDQLHDGRLWIADCGLENGTPIIRNPKSEIRNPMTVVMIQCVGSREEGHLYCSRVCCSEAVKNALKLKERNPDTNVYVLYRDVRTYAFKELYYRKAREAGVLFIRYEPDRKPVVETQNGTLQVTVLDPVLGANVQLQPDYVVLSSAIRPDPNSPDLAPKFKIPLTQEGFFLEAHLKLRPLDFANEGMYLCGLAHSPKFTEETISQARGAVARAATILSKDHLFVGGVVAQVDKSKCVACLTCVRTCPYDVPVISNGVARIEAASCQGCGSCASVCPGKAIQVGHYKDEQILAKCESLY